MELTTYFAYPEKLAAKILRFAQDQNRPRLLKKYHKCHPEELQATKDLFGKSVILGL